ncbi:MAG TPA: hypothetical protein VEL74_03540 [Thermoanaerobaculia bacterium]|nr:hypothetical protein [Thermoanaerobaculia bacterium]
MKTTPLLFLLLSLYPLQALPAEPGAGEPTALEILQRVRTTYASLPSFREEGVITSTGGAGRELRFELGAADGKVSLSASGDFDYGEDGMDDEERTALAVPGLLAEAGWPGSRSATLERQEPCGTSNCWVIALTETPEKAEEGGGVLRLWVDTATYYLWRTELRGPGEFARTLVVEHEPREFAPRAAAGEDLWASAETAVLSKVTLRVTGADGQPVTGLKPQDFRAAVAGQELPVVSVDWVSSQPTGQDGTAPGAGKLVIIFVQAHPQRTRLAGQMQLRQSTRELLGTLAPEDRVAVVSFDSHLKLRQDFTADREAVHQAIDRGMRFGGETPAPPGNAEPETLAAHLDFGQARAAASPEHALLVTGRALARLPGKKVVLFIGYGLGEHVERDRVAVESQMDEALLLLLQGQTSVFVLDVNQVDRHSMREGLVRLATNTGGTYASTRLSPHLAVRSLAGLVSGHYVLTFDGATIPLEGGTLQVTLRDPKRGKVFIPPLFLAGRPQ